MKTCLKILTLFFLILGLARAEDKLTFGNYRGAMLYDNHCLNCHEQLGQWRNKNLVHDRASLRFQVQRWQAESGLEWGNAEIEDVTQYLNQWLYDFK